MSDCLKSPAGIVLLVFLGAAGFFLVLEHRAHILAGDGLVIALLGACVIMHLFMHGSHSRHGDGDGHEGDDKPDPDGDDQETR